MTEHFEKVISELEAKRLEHKRALTKTEALINQLCEMAGLPQRYQDLDNDTEGGAPLALQSDQFYGQPLAGCIRTILEMRRATNLGPATVNDIYRGLTDGGYAFETRNEDNAKRGLRISLSKNTAAFHKLPNGKFGLTEWYPNIKTQKKMVRAEVTGGTEGEQDEFEQALLLEGPKEEIDDDLGDELE